MRRAILLILDGLRRDMLTETLTPNLARFSRASERFEAHRSVFPSATRVVSASVATGCYPARHELQGNSLALVEDGDLKGHDAGHPGFLQHKRRVTGRSLAMPTMAERLAPHGGARIYANASPGAAYAHDPDGHGHVYHRAGSFGPGRVEVSGWTARDVKLGIDGDKVLLGRFLADVVHGTERGKPALGVLWCAEPDTTQHAVPLGSPGHLEVLAMADEHARIVIEAVAAERAKGDDILLLIGSDHGHETVSGVIDIEAELIGAGLKQANGSGDVVSMSNGTSALVYVHEAHAGRIPAIGAFLKAQPWAGRVLSAGELHEIGQAAHHWLAFAIDMAASEAANDFGVPGLSYAAKPGAGKPDRLGCGQHGGLSRFEQSPFLLADGPGFARGALRTSPSSAIDLAPTILTHLGLVATGMDGRPLQA